LYRLRRRTRTIEGEATSVKVACEVVRELRISFSSFIIDRFKKIKEVFDYDEYYEKDDGSKVSFFFIGEYNVSF